MEQPGHHAITRTAVDQLFHSLSRDDGSVMGHGKEQFFKLLDHAQEHADRWHGPTTHGSALDANAQREHSMADPSKSPEQNLRDIRAFVTGNLYSAHVAHGMGKSALEWQYLGAAVHALEDSYSNAHMFRDPSHPTDPHAHIEAINNFVTAGIPLAWNTHDGNFDKVAVTEGYLERATDQAASSAVSELLTIYVDHLSSTPQEAYEAFRQSAGNFYQGSDSVLVLHDHNAATYLAMREDHYHGEICSYDPGHAPQHSSDVNDPNMTDSHGHAIHAGDFDSPAVLDQGSDDALVDDHYAATYLAMREDQYDPGHAPQHSSDVNGPNMTDSHGHAINAGDFDPSHISSNPSDVNGPNMTDSHGHAIHAGDFDPSHISSNPSDANDPNMTDGHGHAVHAGDFDPSHISLNPSDANMSDAHGNTAHVDFDPGM